MPAIAPERLLGCLSPLLDKSNGSIKSLNAVDKIVGLMNKFSKKLVSKCTYINILKATNHQIISLFMERGGWDLVYGWIVDGMSHKNWPLLREVGTLLLYTPVTVALLKQNDLPKRLKLLSKCEDPETSGVISQVVEKWKAQVYRQVDLNPKSSATLPPVSTQAPPQPIEIIDLDPVSSTTTTPTSIETTSGTNASKSTIASSSSAEPTSTTNENFIDNLDLNNPDFNPDDFDRSIDQHLGSEEPPSTTSSTSTAPNQGKPKIIFYKIGSGEFWTPDAGPSAKSGGGASTNDSATTDSTESDSSSPKKKKPRKDPTIAPETPQGKRDGLKLIIHKKTLTSSPSPTKSPTATPTSPVKKKSISDETPPKPGKSKEKPDKDGKKKDKGEKSEKPDKNQDKVKKHRKSAQEKAEEKAKEVEEKAKFDKKIKEGKKHMKERLKEKEQEEKRRVQREKDEKVLESVIALGSLKGSGFKKIPKKTSSFADAISTGTGSEKEKKEVVKSSEKESKISKEPISGKSIISEPQETPPAPPIEVTRRPIRVKVPPSKFRTEAIMQEMEKNARKTTEKIPEPPPEAPATSPATTPTSVEKPRDKGVKRPSIDNTSSSKSEKKAKLDPNADKSKEKDKKSKEKPEKPKGGGLQESSLFMDIITSSVTSKPTTKKRRTSSSASEPKDKESSQKKNGDGTTSKKDPKPIFNFYRERAETEEGANAPSAEGFDLDREIDSSIERGNGFVADPEESKLKSSLAPPQAVGRSRKIKKKVSFRADESLVETFFIEFDPDERVNVHKVQQALDAAQAALNLNKENKDKDGNGNGSKDVSTKSGSKFDYANIEGKRLSIRMYRKLSDDKMEERVKWSRPKLIWKGPDVGVPIIRSEEAQVQKEREQSILGVIYFQGSIPDSAKEPDPEKGDENEEEPRRIPYEDLPGVTGVEDHSGKSWPIPQPRGKPTSGPMPGYTTSMPVSGFGAPPMSFPGAPMGIPQGENAWNPNVPPPFGAQDPNFRFPTNNPPPFLHQQVPPPMGNFGPPPNFLPPMSGPPQNFGFPMSMPPMSGPPGGMPGHGPGPDFANFGGRPPFNQQLPPQQQQQPPQSRRQFEKFERDNERNRRENAGRDGRDYRGDRDRERDRDRDRDRRDRDSREYDRGGSRDSFRSGARGRGGGKQGTVQCRFFSRGYCSKGKTCDFLHGSPPSSTTASSASRSDRGQSRPSRFTSPPRDLPENPIEPTTTIADLTSSSSTDVIMIEPSKGIISRSNSLDKTPEVATVLPQVQETTTPSSPQEPLAPVNVIPASEGPPKFTQPPDSPMDQAEEDLVPPGCD